MSFLILRRKNVKPTIARFSYLLDEKESGFKDDINCVPFHFLAHSPVAFVGCRPRIRIICFWFLRLPCDTCRSVGKKGAWQTFVTYRRIFIKLRKCKKLGRRHCGNLVPRSPACKKEVRIVDITRLLLGRARGLTKKKKDSNP